VLPFLSILGGVAVVRAVRKTTGLNTRIKWPNDVLLGDKKVAGILVESVLEGGLVRYAVVGIGINVSLDTGNVPEIASFATSLNAAAGHIVPQEDLLRYLLQDLDALHLRLVGVGFKPAPTAEPLLEEWKGLLDTLGQRVRVTWGDDTYIGQAEDVNALGQLMLRLDDNRLVSLSSGDITTLRVLGPENPPQNYATPPTSAPL